MDCPRCSYQFATRLPSIQANVCARCNCWWSMSDNSNKVEMMINNLPDWVKADDIYTGTLDKDNDLV